MHATHTKRIQREYNRKSKKLTYFSQFHPVPTHLSYAFSSVSQVHLELDQSHWPLHVLWISFSSLADKEVLT